jgi:hypothetical protein
LPNLDDLSQQEFGKAPSQQHAIIRTWLTGDTLSVITIIDVVMFNLFDGYEFEKLRIACQEWQFRQTGIR